MFNLKEANFGEELVIREVRGEDYQIEYLSPLGIVEGREIIVIKNGKLKDSLIVSINGLTYHLNKDIISRIYVEEKSKVNKKVR